MLAASSALTLVFLLACRLQFTAAQECAADGACDTHERCTVWKQEGECYRNAEYMAEHCPVSCRNETQTVTGCADIHPRCPVWEKIGECATNPTDMHRYCAKSCGVCGTSEARDVQQVTKQAPLCVDQDER